MTPSHRLGARELFYLHEDLTKSMLNIQNTFSLEYYDQSLMGQIQEQLSLLASIHIGAPSVLNRIQYLLSEIQSGHWEEGALYSQADAVIRRIQCHLDWVNDD